MILLLIRRYIAVSSLILSSATIAAQIPMAQVSLLGLPESTQQKVLSTLSIQTEKLSEKTLPARVHLLFRQGETQILDSLKPDGYYNPTIKASLTHTGTVWKAIYRVDPGIPILVHNTNIKVIGGGKKEKRFQHIIDKSGLVKGTILVHSVYQKLKSQLLSKAFALGFFDATFSQHQIQINLSQHQATVILHLNLGKRYTMGSVTFKQKGYQFYPAFLHKYVPFHQGEPYKTQYIAELQNNINHSHYFSQAVVTTHRDSNTHKTHTTVSTQAKPSQEYTIGPGYGTQTGPRILLGFKLRHLTPTGQHFSSQLQLSKVYRNLTMAYVIPGKDPTTDSYSINAAQHDTNISAFYARDTVFGADWIQTRGHFGFKLGLHEHWINYALQLAPKNDAYYLVPSLTLLYHFQKKAGYFNKGFSISATGQGAVKRIFSHTSFIQGIASTKLSLPLLKSNRILLSATIAATKTRQFDQLAPTYRFYAGGLGSVLGYQYQSLSPHNAQGHLRGGKNLLTTSVAFEQHIKGNVSGIVLYNAGNAFDSFHNMKPQQGAGLGFAYQSIVGPINLYITRPIGNKQQHKVRFNFSIGWYL